MNKTENESPLNDLALAAINRLAIVSGLDPRDLVDIAERMIANQQFFDGNS